MGQLPSVVTVRAFLSQIFKCTRGYPKYSKTEEEIVKLTFAYAVLISLVTDRRMSSVAMHGESRVEAEKATKIWGGGKICHQAG